MTKEITNHTAGPRGINISDGSTVWVDPGRSVALAGKGTEDDPHTFEHDGNTVTVAGKLPDFGKPSDTPLQADRIAALEAENASLRAEIDDLNAKLAAFDPDGNGKPGGGAPKNPPALSGKSKPELLKIAADEGVEIEDGATNDDIKAAIELAREAAE